MRQIESLTVDQLKRILASFALVFDLRTELSAQVASFPETLRSILTPPFYWATFYEMSFPKHLAFTAHVAGVLPTLLDRMNSEDPLRSIIDLTREDSAPDWDGGPDGQYEPKYLFGVIYSLNYTIESMVTWSKWLNELVVDTRNGDDLALFKAVQIDRTIMGCPTVADRITLADYERDEGFFKKLRNALKGRPKKPKEEYAELRYILYLFETGGQLDDLTTESAYNLFCEELQLYPADSEDPARSLWQFIRRWKKARQST